jgi:hypothetical protein
LLGTKELLAKDGTTIHTLKSFALHALQLLSPRLQQLWCLHRQEVGSLRLPVITATKCLYAKPGAGAPLPLLARAVGGYGEER